MIRYRPSACRDDLPALGLYPHPTHWHPADLTAALSVPERAGRIIEIGGSEVVTYGEMMTQYAEVRGLKRWMIQVPVLTPRLSSYWVNLVTPIPAVIARPLIEGLRNDNFVHDPVALEMFPNVAPVSYRSRWRARQARARDVERPERWLRASQAMPPLTLTAGGWCLNAASDCAGDAGGAARRLLRDRRQARLVLHDLGVGDPRVCR
jgi:hypothetical protein